MTSEQLFATRATLWRQKAEPLLTLDDAQAWLLQTGLCLFLPRKAQIAAPAPSFVEACLGETNPTPPRTVIEQAMELVVRLIEAGSALPLNLLGTVADHPDFLVSKEALPFVYALRGERDWKQAPGTGGANRVTPLITHIWKLLERRGVLTAREIQEELGKELTEAAVLRALHEMWSSLRVVPLYQSGEQETLWEPLQSRHQQAIVSGAGMSQVTALSVMASVYFQSVIAAGSDEAESFLSPLASRSKVREVIRGLTATRQLASIQMETQSLLYVEGSLPEFPETDRGVPLSDELRAGRKPHPTSPGAMQARLLRPSASPGSRPIYKRPASATGSTPANQPAPRGEGTAFRPRPASKPGDERKRPASGSGRPPFRPSSRPPFRAKSAEPIERSQPGTGLRADGSPKKPRWRDMPGGRPDQKGKPARFGPRPAESSATGRSAPARREPGAFRRPTGTRPAFERASGSARDKPIRPSTRAERPGGAQEGSRLPVRSFGKSAKPPMRPGQARSNQAGPDRDRAGQRPPLRSGANRFAPRPAQSRPFFRPRREEGDSPARPSREGAAGKSRTFTPRAPGDSGARGPKTFGSKPGLSRSGPPRSGAASSGQTRSGTGARPPFGSRPPRPAIPGKSSSAGSFSDRPSSSGSYRRPGFPAGTGTRPSSGRPSSGPPGRDGGAKTAGPSGLAGDKPGFSPRPPSRPNSGPGARSAGGFKPGAGRPKTSFASKPGGRPPAKYRKRPE